MTPKNALVCSFYPPQPDRDSGSQNLSDLMSFLLEEGWRLSFLAANSLGEARYVTPLQQRGVAVYDEAAVDLARLLESSGFDLALLNSWPIAEYYAPVIRRVSPRTRIIVNSLDLHLIRNARRAYNCGRGDSAFSLLDADDAAHMVGELNAYAAADSVLAVSRKEAELVNDFVGDAGLAHFVPDNESLTPSGVPFADRKGMIFVAGFGHPPNAQAVGYLCKEIVPRLDASLLAEHPLYIVGHGLDDAIRGHADGLSGVRMVGWVPGLAPYYERARVSVIPLLYGAGTKRKTVQSLMAGVPTVTTSIGAEGLDLKNGEHALVADGAEEFARAVERLLTDAKLWQRLARQGHEHIATSHSREVARAHFRKAVEGAFAREPKPKLLPEIGRAQFERRVNYQYYQQLQVRIRGIARGVVPDGSNVVVVSEGQPELLRLGGSKGWHFLQDEQGRYAPGYPEARDAITRLEALRAKGGQYLLFPSVALWWLDYYPELKSHLDSRYREVARVEGLCVIYDLACTTQGASEEVFSQVIQDNASAAADALVQSFDAVTPAACDAVADLSPATFSAAQVLTPSPADAPALSVRGAGGFEPSPGEAGGVKLIAFYLPQFHPIPENDLWWGEGFTEWTNVAKAQPLFAGHYQPRLPADLGFYDLRLAKTRQEQAELAREYGVHGFCYYHYWFNGKRLLERPFNEVLNSGEPDLPFCLAWANEPWSRRWNGRNEDVLQPQSYGDADDLAHIRSLLPALADPRAITIDGRPVFIVYQGRDLPDPARTIETWRREVEWAGLPGIYLMTVETGWDAGWDATQVGFDAKVLFQPQFSMLFDSGHRIHVPGKENLRVFDYQKVWPVLANPEPVSYTRYDTVFPSWDNTARTGENGVVLHNSTPEAYEQWLSQAVARASRRRADERVVFINAWNEWAEGAHLEPDMLKGRAYLEATRRALAAHSSNSLRLRALLPEMAREGAPFVQSAV